MSRRIRRSGRRSANTPVRLALKKESALQSKVKPGLAAVEAAHLKYFVEDVRPLFADSLDIDEGFREGREQEHRWDYLLGHRSSNQIIGVEPHSAKNEEIKTVIAKREAARCQLQEHLRDGKTVAKWLWVASGKVQFLPLEKMKLHLDQNGIEFVGTKIEQKHVR